ncbi:MAG: hypothetical protein ACI89X_004467 [Planctomycetota bacterium]|jgi:hypothetical protein
MSIDRRAFLSGLGALPFAARGLAQSALLQPRHKPRSLLLIWLDGGMSHLDTLDCKPEASAEIRGELGTRRCSVDGVFLSEHLPELAKRLHRCALLRSVTHGEGNHDRGSHLFLTGHRPSSVLVHPSLGAVLGHDEASMLPPYIAIPEAVPYAGSGFLPSVRSPFAVGGDPGRPDFAVRNLASNGHSRAHELRTALDALDGAPRGGVEAQRDHYVEMAQRLSDDPSARKWFDLAAEPADLRQLYGQHRLGQSCLLARRLLQGGARTVLVNDRGWDHHQQIKTALSYGFPPKLRALDQALSALLDDLRQQQLEDSVLVCVASEFGRTPRINPLGGRDHWPRAQSVLMFGAGIQPGVVGRTDARGEEPVERPITPGEVFATLTSALGMDQDLILRTADGRPVRLLADGSKPVHEVLRG